MNDIITTIITILIALITLLILKIISIKTDLEMYKQLNKNLYNNIFLLETKIKEKKKETININSDIVDAINYARKAAHPDNGGNTKLFQKYNNLYNKIKDLKDCN